MMGQFIDAKLLLTKKKNNLEMRMHFNILIYWVPSLGFNLLQQVEINYIHFARLYPEFLFTLLTCS